MSFSLTRKTDYALVALSRLAKERKGENRPLSARQLADEYQLPLPLLMNVLKELHRAGILSSRRGSNGGYSLVSLPENISLRHIIEVLEGPVNIALCSDAGHQENEEDCPSCTIMNCCPISDPIQRLNGMLQHFLERISLADLTTLESNLPLAGLGVRV